MRGWFHGQIFRVELAGELADLTLVEDFTFFALYGMSFMVFALFGFFGVFLFFGLVTSELILVGLDCPMCVY